MAGHLAAPMVATMVGRKAARSVDNLVAPRAGNWAARKAVYCVAQMVVN